MTVGRRFQRARPSERVGAGKDEDLPGLDPYPLVRHVGRSRREIEMLDETEAGPIAPDGGPERQDVLENPFAQRRICGFGLGPQHDFRNHGSTPCPFEVVIG